MRSFLLQSLLLPILLVTSLFAEVANPRSLSSEDFLMTRADMLCITGVAVLRESPGAPTFYTLSVRENTCGATSIKKSILSLRDKRESLDEGTLIIT